MAPRDPVKLYLSAQRDEALAAARDALSREQPDFVARLHAEEALGRWQIAVERLALLGAS